MKKLMLVMLTLVLSGLAAMAGEPDLLVNQYGESLKVYNLDITSSNYVYYTLSEEPDAPLYKILKDNILIIKKANGTKIDPTISNETKHIENAMGGAALKESYSPTTFHAIEDGFVDMKFNPYKVMNGYIGMKKRFLSYHPEMPKDEQLAKFILASNENGSILNFRLISAKDKTLAVARPRSEKLVKHLDPSKVNYECPEYSIPDYVIVGDTKYSVVEIDPGAFLGKKAIKNVIFPETLRIIGPRAFENCRLKRIILPESISIVGDMAFDSNLSDAFEEIYIPKSIKSIGRYCFHFVGMHVSPKGYTEAHISCAPDFITTENCTDFGIDDNAIESYERRRTK